MSLIKRVALVFASYCIVSQLSAQWCRFIDTSMIIKQVVYSNIKTTGREAIFVPVVFNILYENEEENISDNQILSQLDVLNEDFSGNNADINQLSEQWQLIAGDAGIHFCLYDLENGDSAIRRKSIDMEEYGDLFSVFHSDAGGIDALDPQHVLNIWVTRLDDQVLGFANPVHQYGPLESGVVVDYRHMGRLGKAIASQPFNLGRTLTHEIGHYFGLLHVWGNFSDECTEDDLVEDTPLQSGPLYDCPNQITSCLSEANVNNFMNLVDDRCMYMFTIGQVDRMKWYISNFLPDLSNSSFCNPIDLLYKPVSELKLKIFPNPNNGAFALQNATGQAVNISVFDAAGHMLFTDIATGVFQVFDLSSTLSGGMYFVVMSNKNETITDKIIITH